MKYFEFGRNWKSYSARINDSVLDRASESLKRMLNIQTLEGRLFLDIGCGSGLFSLAARILGAKVHSFDLDILNIQCTQSLKQKYFPQDVKWTIEQGSVLDRSYLKTLGEFDVVYAWGVLHHTGRLWNALNLIPPLVKNGGILFLSIYNDQGRASRYWWHVKHLYNSLPLFLRNIVVYPVLLRLWARTVIFDTFKGNPLHSWHNYQKKRGMSAWHDVIDWVGGFPFEVAKPEDIFDLYRKKGFILEKLKTCQGGHGCNEFVFRSRIL